MSVRRWSEVTSDPNSDVALSLRRCTLKAARRPSVQSRAAFICALARSKRVLDIGCVDQVGDGFALGPLHRQIAAHAREIVGVDFNAAGAHQMRAEGFDIRVADVTRPGLREVAGGNFGLVVAGELVEHLLNLEGFFANVREVLTPGGSLVITTPNPHSCYLAIHNLLGRPVDNADHVIYHWPSGMAEIAERTGFRLAEIRGERNVIRRNRTLYYAAGRALGLILRGGYPECSSLIYLLIAEPGAEAV